MKPFKHQVIRQLLLSGKSVADTAAEAKSTIGYVNTVRREMIAGLAKAKNTPAAKKKTVKKAAPKQRVQRKHKPMGLVEWTVTAQESSRVPVSIEPANKPWYARVLGLFGSR